MGAGRLNLPNLRAWCRLISTTLQLRSGIKLGDRQHEHKQSVIKALAKREYSITMSLIRQESHFERDASYRGTAGRTKSSGNQFAPTRKRGETEWVAAVSKLTILPAYSFSTHSSPGTLWISKCKTSDTRPERFISLVAFISPLYTGWCTSKL